MNKTEINEMKAKVKPILQKVKGSLREVRDNFKADEDAVGFQRIKSMFVNLWKSGIPGRVALIASLVVLLFLSVAICGECGTSSGDKQYVSQRSKEKDFLDDLKELHDATVELKKSWDKDVKEPFNKLVEELDVNNDANEVRDIEKVFERAVKENIEKEFERAAKELEEDF